MLVVVNFDQIDEDQHADFRAALTLNVNVKEWHRFFGNSYVLHYTAPDGKLTALNELIQTVTEKNGKKRSHAVINPLNKGYSGYGPQVLWDFVDKYTDEVSGKSLPADGKKKLVKERSPSLIDPAALLLSEVITIEGLMLDKETEEAVNAQMARAAFQIAAAKKGVKLPQSFQNILISGKPGIGKSTLAKALALKLGSMIGGDQKVPVYFAKPAQLVGAFRGHSKLNMQALLDEAGDGIVILDEIDKFLNFDHEDGEMLGILNTHMGDKPNYPVVFGTLYEGNKARFKNHDSGLTRRFPHEFAMKGQDDKRLAEILVDTIEKAGLAYEPQALQFMNELIRQQRRLQGANFGHIGEVNNILDKAIRNMGLRHEKNPHGFVFKILAQDVPEYDVHSGEFRLREFKAANDDMVKTIASALAPNIVPLTFEKG